MKPISRKEFLKRSAEGMVTAGAASLTVPGIVTRARAAVTPVYRTLGRTGLKVSAVGFGTVHTDTPNVVRRVVDSGINFIDTGRMYANGKNEEMIGKVVEDVRKNLVIQTKFSRSIVKDAASIRKSIEDSLRALRTDYIDIMLIHSVESEDQLESGAAIDTLSKAREEGKIRFTGFSSHNGNAWRFLKKAAESDFYDVAMVAYNHAGFFDHTVYRGFHVDWNQDALEREISSASVAGMGIAAMKTCSAGPYNPNDGEPASFRAGLKWILGNNNIATMAVCMSNFREVDDDIGVMG